MFCQNVITHSAQAFAKKFVQICGSVSFSMSTRSTIQMLRSKVAFRQTIEFNRPSAGLEVLFLQFEFLIKVCNGLMGFFN